LWSEASLHGIEAAILWREVALPRPEILSRCKTWPAATRSRRRHFAIERPMTEWANLRLAAALARRIPRRSATLRAKLRPARAETPGRSIEVAGRRPVVALRPLPVLPQHFAAPFHARAIAPAADFFFDFPLLSAFASLGHLPGLIALGLGGGVERCQAERQREQQGRSFHGGVPFVLVGLGNGLRPRRRSIRRANAPRFSRGVVAFDCPAHLHSPIQTLIPAPLS
jgi:hypothetical protein